MLLQLQLKFYNFHTKQNPLGRSTRNVYSHSFPKTKITLTKFLLRETKKKLSLLMRFFYIFYISNNIKKEKLVVSIKSLSSVPIYQFTSTGKYSNFILHSTVVGSWNQEITPFHSKERKQDPQEREDDIDKKAHLLLSY